MKVLKEGSGQCGWSTQATCTGRGNGNGGCGATLLVEQTDMYMTEINSYDGSRDKFTTFKCCQCGVETDQEVPSNIKQQLVDKKTFFQQLVDNSSKP